MGYAKHICVGRGGSRAAATSKMECFVITVNGIQPLTITTKHSILNVAATLDPPLCRNRINQQVIVQTLDSVSINTIVRIGYCASFTESKFDVKYVNTIKSTT